MHNSIDNDAKPNLKSNLSCDGRRWAKAKLKRRFMFNYLRSSRNNNITIIKIMNCCSSCELRMFGGALFFACRTTTTTSNFRMALDRHSSFLSYFWLFDSFALYLFVRRCHVFFLFARLADSIRTALCWHTKMLLCANSSAEWAWVDNVAYDW